MDIVISNSSGEPIYKQIRDQVQAQILSGQLPEGRMLPSLRRLARDLKISVLTTTRAYNELEKEGFIISQPGKGFFVVPSSSQIILEQLLKEVEANLMKAIPAAKRAGLSDQELLQLLELLLEVGESE